MNVGMSNDDLDDFLVVQISENGGSTWTTVETVGDSPGWIVADWRILDHVTSLSQIRIRWSVADAPNNSITEAALDAFTIYDAACNEPTWSTFGVPCLGSTSVPILTSLSLPALGSNFQLRVLNTGTAITVMMTGFSDTTWSGGSLPTPLAPFGFPATCQLFVDPAFTQALVPTAGAANWSLPIPSTPSLAGLPIYNQAAVFGTTPAVSQGGAGVVF